jgi:glucan phosphorylase
MNMPVETPGAISSDDERAALNKEALKRAFLEHLFYMQGKFPALATKRDYYLALAYVVRDRLLQRWVSTAAVYTEQRSRTVAYFSAEFLIGPHLGNNLLNLGIHGDVAHAITALGLDFDGLLQQEEEPGLGNGGLGRLAACFLDSMATLEIPALGYGIRFECYLADPVLRESIDLIASGFFSRGETALFRPLIDHLLWSDPYLVLADFPMYEACQERVDETYLDSGRWTWMSILNAARCGKFSSDRTIREYCSDIWRVEPVPIRLLTHEDVKNGFLQ